MRAVPGTDKPRRKRRSKGKRLVEKVLKSIEEKVEKDELKPTVGDLLRLLQAEKELQAEDEKPTEIKVSWVEPDEKEHASEK